MKMNVQPIPTVSDRINEIRSLTAQIVNKEILPNENMLWAWRGDGRVTEAERRGVAPSARAHQAEGEAGGPLGAAPAASSTAARASTSSSTPT